MTTDLRPTLPETAMLTGRGTTALWVILKSLEGRGKYVLMPVNICEIVVPVVVNAGFVPVFHDVDPISGNGTIGTIRKAYRSGISIFLATHNFGTPLDIESVADWARSKDVFLVEDACNALGATWRGRPVGLFGDASIFSFGHAKIVEAGAGGALHVRDHTLKEKASLILKGLPLFSQEHRQADLEFQAVLRTLRQNPLAGRAEVYRALYNAYLRHLLFQPDEALRKAIAEGMDGLDQNLAERREKALLWRSLLDFPPLRHRSSVPGDVYWRYTFLVPESIRDKLLVRLRSHNVPVSKWFPPVHILFDDRCATAQFPYAESFAGQCLNVFVDKSIGKADIKAAARIIRQVVEES